MRRKENEEIFKSNDLHVNSGNTDGKSVMVFNSVSDTTVKGLERVENSEEYKYAPYVDEEGKYYMFGNEIVDGKYSVQKISWKENLYGVDVEDVEDYEITHRPATIVTNVNFYPDVCKVNLDIDNSGIATVKVEVFMDKEVKEQYENCLSEGYYMDEIIIDNDPDNYPSHFTTDSIYADYTMSNNALISCFSKNSALENSTFLSDQTLKQYITTNKSSSINAELPTGTFEFTLDLNKINQNFITLFGRTFILSNVNNDEFDPRAICCAEKLLADVEIGGNIDETRVYSPFDVNKDGVVNIIDFISLKNYLIGK